MTKIPVIDLFSGAGGLGEGFLQHPDIFDVVLSVDSNDDAVKTVTARHLFHQTNSRKVKQAYLQLLKSELSLEDFLKVGLEERGGDNDFSIKAELGKDKYVEKDIQNVLSKSQAKDWVLVGGPPCQAYSNVGRSRNKTKAGYIPEEDGRHYLYREYLKIIRTHWPSVFLMENVPGILSSRLHGELIFNKIIRDLTDPIGAFESGRGSNNCQSNNTYKLFSVAKNAQLEQDMFGYLGGGDEKKFIVKAEDYGIPQTRHRVFILGIRSDISTEPKALVGRPSRTTNDVLANLPRIRSGISSADSDQAWLDLIKSSLTSDWFSELENNAQTDLTNFIRKTVKATKIPKNKLGSAFLEKTPKTISKSFDAWYKTSQVGGYANHQSRFHMPSDIHRYLFASSSVMLKNKKKNDSAPESAFGNIKDFPLSLLPKHKDVIDAAKEDKLDSVKFSNRFKVQASDTAASTVVSHIANDGHYYIHYDPTQSRSLSVREAARIQTFPDNYYFHGSTGSKYRQIGNAVPPFLSTCIATIIADLLDRK